MRYLPINLDIRGRKAVIIGGGSIAARKCSMLLAAGALVTVVAPTLTQSLKNLSENGEIDHLPREYADGDLAGSFLVFAATDNITINREVAEEAKIRGIMANIADSTELGVFTSPAVISRDELLITVSTGGLVPALAGNIREELEAHYGPEYAELNNILGKVREKLLTEKANNQYNKQILQSLVKRNLTALLKMGAYAEIDRILVDICGPGYTLSELGMGEKDN
jgi:precorrin-2 dehydrogenase / sirohydrochlorin ferrochelatase